MEIFLNGINQGGSGGGGGGGITSETFPVHFSYMELSKIFTSQSIGWVTERNNTADYMYTCGGYETATASLQSGIAYLEMPIPDAATGFAPTGFSMAIVGSATGVEDCKLDVVLYTTTPSGTNANIIYTDYARNVNAVNVPQVLNISPTGAFASGRLVAALTFYSKSSKSIKILGGSANFVS